MQSTFLPEESNKLRAVSKTIASCAIPHRHYQQFIRQVTSDAQGGLPGSVILCAAPAAITADEVVASLSEQLASEHCSDSEQKTVGLAVVNTPTWFRTKHKRDMLTTAYRDSTLVPNVRHLTRPRYQLEFGWSEGQPTPMGEISSLIACESSPVFVFKNIHRLQPARGNASDVSEALATICEIAERTQRTHILIGHTRTVLEWMKNVEIARSVTPCLLQPYDIERKDDREMFTMILNTYDAEIPWEETRTLASRIEEVNTHVYGSPHRLRKWLVRSLCAADAAGEATLSWSRMLAARLQPAETKEALEELVMAREFQAGGSPDGAIRPSTAPERAPGRPKPGVRHPDRNGYNAA